MWRVPAVLALLAVVACSGGTGRDAAAEPTTAATAPGGVPAPMGAVPEPTPDTGTETAGSTIPPVVVPEGFERVAATVTTSAGEVCELCLWLAESGDQRSRGLMFATDLGPADGMAFVYPAARTANFWMKNTVLPLSIAFFGADGGYLSSFDMEPCTADPCPLYRTAPDFLVAVETVQGGLADLGIASGSVLELGDAPCP